MINKKKIESKNKFFYIYYRCQKEIIMLDDNVMKITLN